MKIFSHNRLLWNIFISCIIGLFIVVFVRYDLLTKIPENVYLTTESVESSSLKVVRDAPTEVDLKIEGTSVNDIWFTISSGSELDLSAIEVCVYGSDGNEIVRSIIKSEYVSSLSDDLRTAVITLNFDRCRDSELKAGKYRIAFINHSRIMDDFDIRVKEEASNSSLNIGSRKKTSEGKYVIVLVMLLLIMYMMYVCWSELRFYPETFFVVTALFLGVAYMILCVAWAIPETDSHYPAVYRLSNGLLHHEDEWDYRREDEEFLRITGFASRNTSVKDYVLITEAGNSHPRGEYVAGNPKEHMKFYSIFCYLPLVLGLSLGRILNLNPFITHYLARIFSLLVYILLCRHAIRTTPVGKWLFSLIPLLPVPMIFASSFSYDTMLLAVALNFTAAVLRMKESFDLFDEIGGGLIVRLYSVTNRYFFNAFIWTFLLGAVKGGGYVVLFPLTLILLQKPLGCRMHHMIILLCTVLTSLLLFDVFLPSGMHLFQLGGEDPGYLSAQYALMNPYRFVMMTIKAYMLYFDFNFLNLGGMNLRYSLPTIHPTISIVVIILMLFCCYLLGVIEEDEFSFEPQNKPVFLFVIVLTLCTVPIMLLSDTPVNSEIVEGIQGRFFLPAFPILFLYLTKFKWRRMMDHVTADVDKMVSSITKVFAFLSCVNVYLMLRICVTQ